MVRYQLTLYAGLLNLFLDKITIIALLSLFHEHVHYAEMI
jgi:hypothetical protein